MGPARLNPGAIRRQDQLYVGIGRAHVSVPSIRSNLWPLSSFPTFPPSKRINPHHVHQFCVLLPGPPEPTLKHARVLTWKARRFAPFRENPQRKPLFLAPLGHLHCINTGIRTGNTICCALYLTHPTEGVTFTTAILDIWFSSLPKNRRRLPVRYQPRSARRQEKSSENRPQTHSTQ
jgi:hypothetical protein